MNLRYIPVEDVWRPFVSDLHSLFIIFINIFTLFWLKYIIFVNIILYSKLWIELIPSMCLPNNPSMFSFLILTRFNFFTYFLLHLFGSLLLQSIFSIVMFGNIHILSRCVTFLSPLFILVNQYVGLGIEIYKLYHTQSYLRILWLVVHNLPYKLQKLGKEYFKLLCIYQFYSQLL